MKIIKELKYATFEYDEENKEFTIEHASGNQVTLNKVYAFAFMRFIIRMAQRNWLRQFKKSKKNLDKEGEKMVLSEDDNINPNQLFFEDYETSPSTSEEASTHSSLHENAWLRRQTPAALLSRVVLILYECN